MDQDFRGMTLDEAVRRSAECMAMGMGRLIWSEQLDLTEGKCLCVLQKDLASELVGWANEGIQNRADLIGMDEMWDFLDMFFSLGIVRVSLSMAFEDCRRMYPHGPIQIHLRTRRYRNTRLSPCHHPAASTTQPSGEAWQTQLDATKHCVVWESVVLRRSLRYQTEWSTTSSRRAGPNRFRFESVTCGRRETRAGGWASQLRQLSSCTSPLGWTGKARIPRRVCVLKHSTLEKAVETMS